MDRFNNFPVGAVLLNPIYILMMNDHKITGPCRRPKTDPGVQLLLLTFRAGKHRVISMEMLGKSSGCIFATSSRCIRYPSVPVCRETPFENGSERPKPLSRRTNSAQSTTNSVHFTKRWSRRSRPIRCGQITTAEVPKYTPANRSLAFESSSDENRGGENLFRN